VIFRGVGDKVFIVGSTVCTRSVNKKMVKNNNCDDLTVEKGYKTAAVMTGRGVRRSRFLTSEQADHYGVGLSRSPRVFQRRYRCGAPAT